MKTNLFAILLLALAGCTVLDGLAGIKEDGTPMEGPSVVDTVAEGAKSLFGPYGAILGLAIGWGAREYRSFRLRQAGKKDEDRDGVEDPPAPAAT